MKYFKALMATAVMTLSIHSHAALIDDGIHTIDSTTGLSWLDMAETENMSYLQVYNETQSGGLFDGYRIATEQELEALLTSYPFNVDLWNLWAITPNPLTGIYYDDPLIDELSEGVANLGVAYSNGSSIMNGGQYSINIAQASVGTALVQAVPVPASAYLFMSGLLGLFGVYKRKHAD